MIDFTKPGGYCLKVVPEGTVNCDELTQVFSQCPGACQTMPMARLCNQLVIVVPECFIHNLERKRSL